MTIIKVQPVFGTQLHLVQTQSHREECWEEGYIEVPENLERKVMDCYGFCDLVIANGALVDVVPSEIPAPPAPKLDPITQVQLAVAELAEVSAQRDIENKLAIAELAEAMTGGK